jgi:hypothetical protein
MIRSFPDYIQIEFPEWQYNYLQSRRIPRLFDAAKDTLSFSGISLFKYAGPEFAIYVRGTGLVSYGGVEPRMLAVYTSLDLIGHTSP